MFILTGIVTSIILFNIGLIASLCRLQTKCEKSELKIIK